MTDHAGFLRSILDRPDDDLPRLVFADWLDEHGESERAGYVRAHVEVARLVALEKLDADEYVAAVTAVVAVPAQRLWEWARDDHLPVTPGAMLGRDTVGAVDTVRDAVADLALLCSRGFVGAVRCRASFWAEAGRLFVAAAPVERVEFADRKPYSRRRGEWVWRLPEGSPGDFSNVVPRAIFDHLSGDKTAGAVAYPTRKDAVDALSAASLASARRQG